MIFFKKQFHHSLHSFLRHRFIIDHADCVVFQDYTLKTFFSDYSDFTELHEKWLITKYVDYADIKDNFFKLS